MRRENIGADGSVAATPKEAAEQQEAGPSPESSVVATGRAMLDHFVQWYFGVAFAFLFKYCTRHARHARMELTT